MGTAFAALLAGHHRRAAVGGGRRFGFQCRHLRHPLGLGHALRQDVLYRVGHRRHFGVVPHGHACAVGLLVGAQAHRTAVPGHLAHVAQGALQEAAACRQRQQAHAGGNPLLRLAALAHGHEEFDGTVHRALAVGHRHGQKGHQQVQGFLTLMGPVLDLLGHGRERALGAAADDAAHGVDDGGRCRRRCGRRVHLQHRAQDGVGAVGRQALQACVPGLLVQALEIVVGVVGRDVDGLGDGGIDVGLDRLHHGDVAPGRHVQRRDEISRQLVHVAPQLPVEAPGVVFDRVLAGAAVGFAFLALVHPGERGLDAVGCVVGKSQADGAGGGDGQQVAVADAVRADGLLQCRRQAAGEGAGRQVAVGVEFRKAALLLRQGDGGGVGAIAHGAGDAGGHVAPFLGVVAQAQHGQHVAHAGEANADAALGGGFVALLLQRPEGDVKDVVERPHLGRHGLFKGLEVEGRNAAEAEGVAHEARQDDGAEVAAAVGRKRLFATGVGGRDRLAVIEVVVLVDVVQEQDAGFGKVIGRAHHRVPQLAGRQRLVHPQAVGALVGALRQGRGAGLRAVHQLPVLAFGQCTHEGVGDADGDVEVVPAPGRALGGDEFLHIRVVDAQHPHLCAAARTGAFHRRARLVEDVDVAARARGHGGRALDGRATRTDAREVVADAAAAAHGFGRFAQRFVNAGVAVFVHALDAVAHRLHKAVDERGLDGGAGGAHDASGADGTRIQVVQEQRFVLGPLAFGFDRCQGTRHAAVQVIERALAGFEVFLRQHVLADGLDGQYGLGLADGIAFHRLSSSGGRRGSGSPLFNGDGAWAAHTRRVGCVGCRIRGVAPASGGALETGAGSARAANFTPGGSAPRPLNFFGGLRARPFFRLKAP